MTTITFATPSADLKALDLSKLGLYARITATASAAAFMIYMNVVVIGFAIEQANQLF